MMDRDEIIRLVDSMPPGPYATIYTVDAGWIVVDRFDRTIATIHYGPYGQRAAEFIEHAREIIMQLLRETEETT